MTDIEQQWRERIAQLPDGTLRLNGYLVGECVVALVDANLPSEHVVVLMADDCVETDPELIDDWAAGRSPHVTAVGGRFTFGTAGEGEGVVTYELINVQRLSNGNVLLRRVFG